MSNLMHFQRKMVCFFPQNEALRNESVYVFFLFPIKIKFGSSYSDIPNYYYIKNCEMILLTFEGRKRHATEIIRPM